MSFGRRTGGGLPSASRYVPHSDVTKTYYERLLQDLRRYLPPGVDDDVEEVAEQVLAIVCTAAGSAASAATPNTINELQQSLERLLDTRLSREVRDHLLHYGKLITDYVASSPEGDAEGRGGIYGAAITSSAALGVDDLDFAGPSSSSSSSSDSEAGDAEERRTISVLTGGAVESAAERKERRKKRRALMQADQNLTQYAFTEEGGIADTVEEAEAWSASAGAAPADVVATEDDDDEGGLGLTDTPKIAFDEVACNPQYIKDAVRRLFPAHEAETCQSLAERVIDFLSQRDEDDFTLETQLTTCLGGYEDEAVMDWIGDVVQSRWSVVYGLRYAQCGTQKERYAVMDAMRQHALDDSRVEHLYQSITGNEVDPLHMLELPPPRHNGDAQPGAVDKGVHGNEEAASSSASSPFAAARQPTLRRVDLQACAFQDERTPHLHVRATVPQGTQRLTYETHDEVILPPSSQYNTTTPPVSVESSFPGWALPAFPGMTHLNAVQSKVYECAFHSDENMLVSAPTGAGKTNVAMMAMLRAIDAARNTTTGVIDGHSLKMVYVAPMKALVQEVVRTFSRRLEPLGLTVAELSGDAAMTQQQMATTQLIVTTPEKWDIVTRKSVELGVASLLKLLILDEVHLLHNERGPVLEAIVARTLLQQQLRGEAGIRIVGLSATLPNYADVATFLQVNRQRGLFVFDSSYRPIPLEQTYCATKKVKGVAQSAVMNVVAYDKVLQTVQAEEQVMIFVHSRRETEFTARYLQKRAAEEHRGYYFVQPDSNSHKALQEASSGANGAMLRRSLQQLLPDGFGIHHAGLSREERSTVEQLFAERHIKVLVCTSTLAWGVNLPANRVIIKGTRVFNGAKGQSELLSALDVLQMFGRAGRVGFGAALGRATIITSPDDLHYYLSVLNQQLPIESQMMKRVVDMLNAEITLGHVETVEEGVQWLQRSYLYVRMRQVPEVYGIRPTASDPLLLHHLANIVHTACEELRASKMADYDARARRVSGTAYGRIASYCYITTTSMAAYLGLMSNAMQDVELFRVFSASSEFANIGVRAEEQAQLKELLDSAPVAVRESRYTPLAKINILLQCFISQKELEGLPLMSEMVYVKDSAQRILRALYDICLVREYGRTARQFLNLYLMTVHRQWTVQSPLRQVRDYLPVKHYESILSALERVRVPWEEIRSWSVEDLAERLSDDRRAQSAYEAIHVVPHYAVEAAVRPLTRGMLYIDVDILADFDYVETVHGRSVCEVVLMIEHTNGRLLHHEAVLLPLANVQQRASYACPPVVVPMVDPTPTHLFARVVSPHWLGASATASVCLLNTLLPPVAAPLREVDQRPPSPDTSGSAVAERLAAFQLHAVGEQIFPFQNFTALQSDLVDPILLDHPRNLLVGVPPGSGKTVLAELFVLQFLLEEAVKEAERQSRALPGTQQGEDDGNGADAAAASLLPGKLLYLTSNADVVHRRALDWRYKFGEVLKQRVVELTAGDGSSSSGGTNNDGGDAGATKLASATIILATGEQLIRLVRRGDAALAGVTHIVVDHLHLLRSSEGQAMEECMARLNAEPFLVRHGTGRARILGLTYPLISTAEVGRWLKVSATHQFNYGNSYRQLRVRLVGVELPGPRSRYESGAVAAIKLLRRPAYAAVPTVIFVPTTRQAKDMAQRVLLRCRDNYIPETTEHATDDPRLAVYLAAGVAYLHRRTSELDALTIQELVDQPALHAETQATLPLLLVCTFDAAWRLPAALFTNAVICCGERLATVESEDGERGMTYADCSAVEVMQMCTRAVNEAVLYCRSPRVWVWGKLLNEPLPLESGLRYADDFRDAVNAAIAQGRAASRADVLRVLSSHYFLHHVKSNLHFYGVPTAADVPLYASSVASHVVNALKVLGCVEELRVHHDNEEAADEAEEAEDEEDPHAPLRPTVRGLALAHHCLAVSTAEELLRVLPGSLESEKKKAALHDTTTYLWRMLAYHCEELTPAHLGDAARVTEAAEYRALHSLARALPDSLGVRYIDIDFSAAGTKVYLLLLAYCCRLFPASYFFASEVFAADGGAEAEKTSAFDAHHGHVFYRAAVSRDARTALCNAVSADLAERLVEDLRTLLPAVRHVVSAVVELLDGDTQAWAVARLIRLTSALHQQLWESEPAVLQLPCWRAPLFSSPSALTSIGATCTLEELQDAPDVAVTKLESCVSELVVASGSAAGADAAAATTARRTSQAAVQEAGGVPRVVAVRAKGRVEEMDGVLAMIIHIDAQMRWAPPRRAAASTSSSSGDGGDNNGDSAEVRVMHQWWVRCVVSQKASPSRTRQLALRVSSVELTGAEAGLSSSSTAAKTASAAPSLSTFSLSSDVFFPLARLEAEDLDTVEMRAVVTSVAFCGVEGTSVVVFDAEDE
ncbi:putative ATP-dependent RNA helicase [Leptomonas pyrrhocoris]|uniref:Putative ATP-dependent RNA helicase n=1 Tax=Leptomonas pyrrhocoris TaxID=157538 RepID=A0A0M9FUH8_LEPPY|nr:putative ATP-dependent RNA helicase [Leptomonas pyrrhocoris]KPA76217.1 putative ATP-dependent RNA helicase [Leptomonas pyrrhocoris]|eukprot:XP_015654656.1 putative ATP-dependent RNA helicase [Leptomonas pyrrhocoris]